MELTPGTTLIEASAGTGKTYTLCRIALRLTLEKGIPLDRILAVTFTEAATDELARRIRELYQNCLDLLDGSATAEEEPLLDELIASGAVGPEEAARRLRYSLAVFEEAPISTIHGFCKRALERVALETDLPLDAQLEPVENEIVEQLLHEYVREAIVERSPALCLELQRRGKPYFDLLRAIGRESSAHPYARIVPAETALSLERIDALFQRLPDDLQALMDQRKEILPALKANSRLAKQLDGRLSSLSAVTKRGCLFPQELDELSGDLSYECLDKALKKGQTAPRPIAAFDTLEQLNQGLAEAFNALVARCRSWLSERLAAAKERRNLMSFNDLLHRLNGALQRDADGSLAASIASDYDAALIDEFQDTDPIQYEIAIRLFGRGDHYLFYIGDPKQAIYRFRGADIFAYFRATRQDGLKRATLDRNYRSAPALVESINLLFQNSATGFLYPDIQYTPITAAKAESPPFRSQSPLAIRHILPDAQRPATKRRLLQQLAQLAADDLAGRLNADSSLAPDQVTFLVNTRYEADALARALERRGIAPDIRAERSVFQTEEALAIEHLLRSLSQPNRASWRRAVQATSLCGCTRWELRSPDCEPMIRAIDEQLLDWARNWGSKPFDAALADLMNRCHAADRLARRADGERRFATIRHLAELLSEACRVDALTPQALLNWLRFKRNVDVSQEEDYQTRLSSDRGKPQIVTVHKSKGLEFPIVILPFLGFLRSSSRATYSMYHDEDHSGSPLTIDFSGSNSASSQEAALREELAEQIRLIYVALTRARFENRIYLCPERLGPSLHSAFAAFLLGDSIAGERLPGDPVSRRVADRLSELAGQAPELIDYQAVDPKATGHERYQPSSLPQTGSASPRVLDRIIPGPARVLSFSALSRILRSSEEALPEPETESKRDELALNPPPALKEKAELESQAQPSIFSLPRGTAAGDLLHLILERFDFRALDSLAGLTQQAFAELQFQPAEYQSVVQEQIALLAQLRLDAPETSFRLCEVPPANRVAELEFAYPTAGDTRAVLAEAFATSELGKIPRNWTRALRSRSAPLNASFLRGFIDLIVERDGRFYIFDWKSNHLGNRCEDYSEERLVEAMAAHDYFLQYCLYCAALKRFIEYRYPGEDFYHRLGGVFYVFLRGLRPHSSNGVFFDLPPKSLLVRLDRALSGADPNEPLRQSLLSL